MTADQLTWLLENWDSVGVGLILFLALVVFGFLFFTDRLSSPKTTAELRTKVQKLEEDCAAKDAVATKAASELVDARIIYAQVSTKLEFLERDKVRLEQEAQECRRHLETARERERWGSPGTRLGPEGQS